MQTTYTIFYRPQDSDEAECRGALDEVVEQIANILEIEIILSDEPGSESKSPFPGNPGLTIEAALLNEAWRFVQREGGDGAPYALAVLDKDVEPMRKTLAEAEREANPMLSRIRGELDRVGVGPDTLGPVDGVVASFDRDDATRRLTLADDGDSWTGSAGKALDVLRELPDGAGWNAFWDAFGVTAEQPEVNEG